MNRQWFLFLGPLAATIMGTSLTTSGYSLDIGWTAGIATLCAIWWISEAIPIPATSLIPLALFPLTGVLDSTQIAESFGSWLVLLMLGGFILSAAMERSGAHRRLALNMVALFGGRDGRRLVLGFMAASAILSMWISNAATTLMLMPIAAAVAQQTANHRLRSSLFLGIAYAASIGGIGTPIGTPPNMILMDVYENVTGDEIGFLSWMSIGLPVVLVMLPLAGFWLTRNLRDVDPVEVPGTGEWTSEEVRTLLVFAVTALLWMTRTQPWGGWSELIGVPAVKDSSVALMGALALFLIPNGKGEKLMDWPTAARIPWGILVLFAGGICLAKAFVASGLSEELGRQLTALQELPGWLLLGCICLCVTFLTEVTSNTATTNLLMPVLAAAALGAAIDPRFLMIPAALSASFAFMLPVATPPNAIVFSSGDLTAGKMAREGIALNLAGVVVVTTYCVWVLQR